MKRSTSLKGIAAIALFGALLTMPTFAQDAPLAPDNAPVVCPPCVCPNLQPGHGHQHGHKHPGRRGGWDKGGHGRWASSLLTQDERVQMIREMRTTKTLAECNAVQAKHRQLLEARAKEQDITLPAPRRNRCEKLKAKGIID